MREDDDVPDGHHGQLARFELFPGLGHSVPSVLQNLELIGLQTSLYNCRSNRQFSSTDPAKSSTETRFYPAFSIIGMDTSRFSTISRLTSNSLSRFWLGRWYIRSSMRSSRIMRSPRAPTFLFRASRATARVASSLNLRRTFSNSNSRWYCLMMALRGLVRIST